MKRKRQEMETRKTEIKAAIEELSSFVTSRTPTVGEEEAELPIKPFLSICKLIVQFLDKIGPTMAVIRQDIDQNIQRLEKLYESDPFVYSNFAEILQKEKVEGTAKIRTSCSRASLWITRTMDFMVGLLQGLARDSSPNIQQAVEESYNATLKPWHGWIASAAVKVAMKLVPDDKTFMTLLGANDGKFETIKKDIETLVSLLLPLLQELHCLLELYGLERLKST